MKTLRYTLLLLPLLLQCSPPAEAQASFPPDAQLRTMIRYLVEDGEAPGVVLGLLEADGSTRVFSHGSGGPDARPLSAQSVFEIGSMTKAFAGTLLAVMVTSGDVALEDPVSNYLPADVAVPARDGREITLLDLATHTSGLPRLPDGYVPSDYRDPYADWTVDRLHAWLTDHELRRAPGAGYEYSNLGVGLLGHALARAAGTPFRDLLHERVLDPLGMDMTGFATDEQLAEWMVRGHAGTDVVPHWTTTEAMDAAGALRSNAEDLLAYLAANVGAPETDLERAMRLAHEPRRPTANEGQQVGLGWVTRELNGRTIVSHTGATGGFGTQMAFDPDRELGVVVLANSTGFADNLFLDLLLMGPVTDVPDVALEPAALAPLEGEYRSGAGLPLYVRVDEEGWLSAQARDQVRFRLHAASDSVFSATRVPVTLTFRRNAQGGIEHVVFGTGNRTSRFDRVGDDVPPPAVAAGNANPPLSPAEIERYAGTYLLELAGQPAELRIYGEGGRLFGDLGGQAVSALVHRGDHEFTVAISAADRLIFHVENGRAERLTFVQGGQRITGVRQ